MKPVTILAPTAAALMAACAGGGAQISEKSREETPTTRPIRDESPVTTEPAATTTEATTTTATTAPARREPITVTTATTRPAEPQTDDEWWAGQPGYDGRVPDDVWWSLALCEDSGSNRWFPPYSGYFHFLPSTWQGLGRTGYPHEHDYATQQAAAEELVALYGWGQFPGCARKLGLL